MIIESGGSNATAAVVNEEGRLLTLTVNHESDFHANNHAQTYWSVPFKGINPTSTNDYFFYFKNTGTATYAVPDIRIQSDTTGAIEVHWVSGTASSLSDITPVNRNLGAAPVISGTIGTAVDITGLSNLGILAIIDLKVTVTQYHLSLSSKIIVPPGQAFALMTVVSAGDISGMVSVMGLE